MKWFAGAMPLIALLAAMPAFGAAPVIRSSAQTASQAEVMRPATRTVESRLELVERRMQALTDILMRLDRIQQEIQQLRGDVELQEHSLESLKKRQRDLYGDIDRRMMQLSGKQLPATSVYQPQVAVPPSSYPTTASDAPLPTAQAQPQSVSVPTATTEMAVEQRITTSLPTTAPSQSVGVDPLTRPPLSTPPGAASQTVDHEGVPVKEISTSPQSTPASIVGSTPMAGAAPGPGSADLPTAVAVPVAPPADPALEQPMYKQAFDLLMQRRYDEAKQSFRAFLRQYPNGRLAANAQYWVGEASYVTRDFATALDEFSRVVQNYPTSPKVSDSLLKIAFIQYEQKEWAQARKTLETVIQEYASSTAARLARKRLERMRIEGN